MMQLAKALGLKKRIRNFSDRFALSSVARIKSRIEW